MTGVVVAVACVLAGSLVRARERRCDVLAARARHEVRGPLCTARLALDGLDRCARVEAIDAELRRAALALDDLARDGRAPRRHRTPVDVTALLREAEPAWQAFATTHVTRLTLELPADPLRLTTDPLRLTQACANLVANAIEHGGDRVTVRVGRTEAAGAGSYRAASNAAAPKASAPAAGVYRTAPIRARAVAAHRVASIWAAARGGPGRARTTSGAAGCVRIEVVDSGPGLPAPLPVLLAAARGRRTVRGHGLAIAASIAEREGGRLTETGPCVAIELPGR